MAVPDRPGGAEPVFSIRAGRPDDAAAVLAMLDGAVRWLVAPYVPDRE